MASNTINMRLIAGTALFSAMSDSAFAERITGPAYVRDADTIVISRTEIRLYGVDAPELYTRFGRLAATFLHDLLQGETVRCDVENASMRQPLLGTCYIEVDGNNLDIAAILVSVGHALDCQAISGGRYRNLEQPDVRSRFTPAEYC
ncbi:thermonuclease family protein [Jannaschia sp. CCS1]|uniref:thermonuclease family protein n=1 Tax=Jannaschia sp. (strain CCS1) TaxID=290400 RepID=UPI00140FDFA2|nr:thermonuclease family protein [Jannaschia sp. CCS1]